MRYKAGMPVLAMAMALAVAGPAQGATSYPSGGSGFAAGLEGWTGSETSCSAGLGSLCTTSTVHEPAVGNPPGSISVRMAATVNLAGTFVGAGAWTSPAFTVPAGEAVTGATFSYDRQLVVGGLVNLAPESTVTVALVDVGASSTATLLSEELTSGAAAFARRAVGVPTGAVVPGHTYRLRIATTTTTTTAAVGVLGQENTRFDNVALAVDRGNSVSPGVTVKPFKSLSAINSLFYRFNENAEVGRRAGGSLIPRKLCTIVGTARADRIVGTSGNDVICGMGGNDVIKGGRGIDIIDGGNGNDRVSGGSRKDKLIGLRGKDRLNGNAGNDRAGGGAGRDRVSGASGVDRLGGGSGRDALLGGPGRDRLNARDRQRDRVDGGKGRDRAKVDRRVPRAGRNVRALRRTDRVRRVERLT